jgi:hypothetical protein
MQRAQLHFACRYLPFDFAQFSSIPFQVYGGLPCSSSSAATTLSAYAQILFSGIGQIYLVGDPISGAIMLAGVVFSSRVCAACMCAGVVVGSLVGAFIGASICELASGLYGYDSSLSFIAVYYALCSNSDRKLLHATVAAAAATLMHTAVSVTMAKVALPSGTLGFVFATMVVVCCVKGTEKDEHQRAPADDAALAVAPEGNSGQQLQVQHRHEVTSQASPSSSTSGGAGPQSFPSFYPRSSRVFTDIQLSPANVQALPMPNLMLEQQHQQGARDTHITMLQLV